ncbi:MAG: exopolysaccharide Pel transporter PelG [Lachnospiraceae bacterium]|nr:exopolysaccharide Pel transporter PelG [Lachnospiraceae bacterium]
MLAMITYALIASLIFSGIIAMPLTRYVSDMLYINKIKKIMPSMYGALSLILPVGCVSYFIFLAASDLPLSIIVLNALLFAELTTIWIMSNYLTAIRNYKGIAAAYIAALVSAVGASYIIPRLLGERLEWYLLSICIGYGIQLLVMLKLLYDFFPEGDNSTYDFTIWLKKYWRLIVIGLGNNIAVFAHIVLTWHSPINLHLRGLFYTAPDYDIPTLYAYLATLVTTIYFTTKAETDFYDKYDAYFSALNYKGTISEVQTSHQEMIEIMWTDAVHGGVLQLLMSAAMMSVGLILFQGTQPGASMQMQVYFIMLSLGYGLYATGNMLMLYSMYFADYKSGMIDIIVFAVSSTGFTWANISYGSPDYYGTGFLAGCFLFLIISFVNLRRYTSDLTYEVLAKKPFISSAKKRKNASSKKLIKNIWKGKAFTKV